MAPVTVHRFIESASSLFKWDQLILQGRVNLVTLFFMTPTDLQKGNYRQAEFIGELYPFHYNSRHSLRSSSRHRLPRKDA